MPSAVSERPGGPQFPFRGWEADVEGGNPQHTMVTDQFHAVLVTLAKSFGVDVVPTSLIFMSPLPWDSQSAPPPRPEGWALGGSPTGPCWVSPRIGLQQSPRTVPSFFLPIPSPGLHGAFIKPRHWTGAHEGAWVQSACKCLTSKPLARQEPFVNPVKAVHFPPPKKAPCPLQFKEVRGPPQAHTGTPALKPLNRFKDTTLASLSFHSKETEAQRRGQSVPKSPRKSASKLG